jgi:hypothetical protein
VANGFSEIGIEEEMMGWSGKLPFCKIGKSI